ncbi:MAG: hypothetical protein MHMPM18_003082 [Marteilia pararefringens]
MTTEFGLFLLFVSNIGIHFSVSVSFIYIKATNYARDIEYSGYIQIVHTLAAFVSFFVSQLIFDTYKGCALELCIELAMFIRLFIAAKVNSDDSSRIYIVLIEICHGLTFSFFYIYIKLQAILLIVRSNSEYNRGRFANVFE